MLDTSTLLVFSLAALALVLVPGPSVLYVVTRSISQGRRAGVASALGTATGTFVHVAAAALGLSALLTSSVVALNVVKYLGAAYLVYLGVRTLLTNQEMQLDGLRGEGRLSRVYVQGALVNVLNPKVALFFLAFLPQFVDPDRGGIAAQILVLGSLYILIGLTCEAAYALVAGSLGEWLRRRESFVRRQRYLTGAVYVGLGVAAAFTSVDRAEEPSK